VEENILQSLETLETEMIPSKTYRIINGRIIGMIDGLESVVQAVDKILRTERFVYEIYGEEYGIELERFIGANFDFVKADLQRTIKDALFIDERIEDITDFEMEQVVPNTLKCRFTVNTIEGTFAEMVVSKVL